MPLKYNNPRFLLKQVLKYILTDWASRCKQIMKIWRKVSAPDKVPFLVRTCANYVTNIMSIIIH